MQHFCYHIISDHRNQYETTLEDAKKLVAKWKKEGDSDFRVYLITTEDKEDAILIDEVTVPIEEIYNN
ncbi:MAG: hypothetical protein HND52_00730 [Ignavibacteriae bacterium]|nr:hypothetical protein [Ignavibacteriota bacterium]NOG96472.1 hypothetical protein [Ignavibacteriota bacterium]